ncbi:hypothetical protein D3C73_1140010 [compost metagenome]
MPSAASGRQALAKRQEPTEAPISERSRGAAGSHSPNSARSRPWIPNAFGPPAAPGKVPTSAALKPFSRMRAKARGPALRVREGNLMWMAVMGGSLWGKRTIISLLGFYGSTCADNPCGSEPARDG